MSRRHSRMLIESQVRQIDDIFRANSGNECCVTVLECKTDKNCYIHGVNGVNRRGSSVSRRGSTASTYDPSKRNSYCGTPDSINRKKMNRNSIASFTELVHRPNDNGFRRESVERDIFQKYRRDSAPVMESSIKSKKSAIDNWNSRLFKGMEHPSNFPNMLRSSSSTNQINSIQTKQYDKLSLSRRSSSQWSVNSSNSSNLDKKVSVSTSDKLYKRDYTLADSKEKINGITNGVKKETPPPTSILKKKTEDDLKEIIKRLSFDYIESEVRNGRKSVESDRFSDVSGSRSKSPSSTKTPRRVSIDSLDSRRSSRRYSDFSINGDEDIDDHVLFKNRNNSKQSQVSRCDCCL